MTGALQAIWGGLDSAALEALAQTHGTPFYVHDADRVNARIRAIRKALRGTAEVYFAVKANPNLELLRAVRGVADGLDISSGGELEQALLAGHDPATLSFAGPAKTRAELTEAIRHGIGSVSVESPRELAECIRCARELGRRANIVVRVNPQFLNRAFGMKMGGKAVQFGVDEEHLIEVLQTVVAHPAEIDFRGIHIYAGSQCFDAAGVLEGVENTLRIVRKLEAETPLVCRTINLGGGFGVSHTEADKELGLEAVAALVAPCLEAFAAEKPHVRRIVFELGRYLVADAGLYVARVVSSKVSRGKEFFMVDGGLHHHLAAAGTFGAALRSNFLLANLTRPAAAAVRCQIAGPSCNPTDLLGIEVDLPRPEEGDLIGVLKSGSYGLTASPLLFLGRPTPPELVLSDGQVILGRRRRAMTEFN